MYLERRLLSQEACCSYSALPPASTSSSRVCRDQQSASYRDTRSIKYLGNSRNKRRKVSIVTRAAYEDELPLPYLEQEYTALGNEAYWSLRPITVLKRTLQIGAAFSGWFLATRLGQQDPRDIGGKQAELLRKALTNLGPAFVKIGQAVSSRPDIVPPSYTRELEKLQDKIPPFSDVEAMLILREELGRPATQVFSDMSPTSIAAASLGQVYKARVRSSGRVVAVKVQRPNVREAIALDVYIMRYLVGRFGVLRKLNSDLTSLLDEWAASLFRELDYRKEAQNGTKFKELYSHLEGVYIPDMVHELTTQRLLTMEWVEGVRIRSAGEDPSVGRSLAREDMRLVGYGVQCSLEQMLEDGFYHADPHPGNLLRTNDGKLGYLDFGMMATIDSKIRQGLIRATLHMVNREFQALANDFETLGLLPAGSDKQKVVPALTAVFEKALAGGVSNMSFSSLSGELGKTMYEFKFRIPSYYTLLVRSLSVLEGIALSSDPNYKVLGAAYPWIARRLLTDSNPELQETLRVLLYKGNTFQFSRLESLLRQALKSPARVSRPLVGAPVPAPAAPSPATTATMQRGGPAFQRGGGYVSPAYVSTEPAPMEKPLELLLGKDGSYVRGIVVDELAKGVDAAWRMSADSAVQDARTRLRSFLQRPAIYTGQGAVTTEVVQPSSPPATLLATLNSFPTLSDQSDATQVDGIMSLVKVLQEVRQNGVPQTLPPAQASLLPAQVQETILMLQWFVNEAQQLSPEARMEALRLPLSVGAKLSSRIAARALKAFLGNGSTSTTSSRNGSTARNGISRSSSATPTKVVGGTLQPASRPPAQPIMAVGNAGAPILEDAISRPPGDASVARLTSQGGGLVAPSPEQASQKPAVAVRGRGVMSRPRSQPTVRVDATPPSVPRNGSVGSPPSFGVGTNGSSGTLKASGKGKTSQAQFK